MAYERFSSFGTLEQEIAVIQDAIAGNAGWAKAIDRILAELYTRAMTTGLWGLSPGERAIVAVMQHAAESLEERSRGNNGTVHPASL